MSWNGTRVLVTGAGGFIGGYLISALSGHGALVTALATNSHGLHSDGINCVTGDITDPASLKGICEDIDVVYHLAANFEQGGRRPGGPPA
jgi:UDP-glucose 4-epimerase